MSKGTILVVDTDPMHKNEWERIANGNGYSIERAHGVSDALKILDQHPDTIQAVVSDLHLADGRNGMELLRQMRLPDTNSMKEPHKHPFIIHTPFEGVPPECRTDYQELKHEISKEFFKSDYYNIEGEVFNAVLDAMGEPALPHEGIVKFTPNTLRQDRAARTKPTNIGRG